MNSKFFASLIFFLSVSLNALAGNSFQQCLTTDDKEAVNSEYILVTNKIDPKTGTTVVFDTHGTFTKLNDCLEFSTHKELNFENPPAFPVDVAESYKCYRPSGENIFYLVKEIRDKKRGVVTSLIVMNQFIATEHCTLWLR